MDAGYLQREVGVALAKGLAALAVAQPHDPVEYLGQYLLQHVKNQAAEEEAKKEAEQLQIEKKKHAEAQEWERIRLEQEELTRQEELLAADRAKQQVQLDMVKGFEDKVKQREAALQEGTQVKPLNMLTERLHVIKAQIEEHKPKLLELYKLRGITSPDHHTAKVVKASVVLVGWSQLAELNDWADCKKIVRSPEVLEEMKNYSPLKRQTVHRFGTASHLIKDISAEELKKTSFATYLVWEWVTTCIKTRRAALVVRSERLKIPLIGDPEFADAEAGGDDEEEDLEEELKHTESAKDDSGEGGDEDEGDEDEDEDEDDDED